MFEVRKSGNSFRVYDKIAKKYICNTTDEEKANDMAHNLLYTNGFEGEIPKFMTAGLKFGIPLDQKK